MSKIHLTNLSIVLTERCNLNCVHCMRGGSLANDLDIKTLKSIIRQVSFVDNLTLCGGEPLIDADLFNMLVDTIILYQLPLGSLSFITNGTIYDSKTFEALNRLDDYIYKIMQTRRNCRIVISFDKYHEEQIDANFFGRQYFRNMAQIISSPYYRDLIETTEIYDSGNARNLDVSNKIPITPTTQFYYEKKGILTHGPLLSILSDGTISESDGEFTYLRDKYNYGNINSDNLETIIRNQAIKCHSKLEFNYRVYQNSKKFNKI